MRRKIELILTGVRVTWRNVGEPHGGPETRFDADRLREDVEILTDVLRSYVGRKKNIQPGQVDPDNPDVRLSLNEGEAIKTMVERLADAVEAVALYVRKD